MKKSFTIFLEADVSKMTEDYKSRHKIGPGSRVASDFMTERIVILFPDDFMDFARGFEMERRVS